MCAPVVNRDVNQLELGRRPWSSPTLDLGRRSRVEEREVDPESGDYGLNKESVITFNPAMHQHMFIYAFVDTSIATYTQ